MVGQIQAEPLIHETHQTGSIKVADPISDFPDMVCAMAFIEEIESSEQACRHGAEMWWRWGRNGANDVQNETNLLRN